MWLVGSYLNWTHIPEGSSRVDPWIQLHGMWFWFLYESLYSKGRMWEEEMHQLRYWGWGRWLCAEDSPYHNSTIVCPDKNEMLDDNHIFFRANKFWVNRIIFSRQTETIFSLPFSFTEMIMLSVHCSSFMEEWAKSLETQITRTNCSVPLGFVQ